MTTIQQERTDIDVLIEQLTRFRNQEAKLKNNQVRVETWDELSVSYGVQAGSGVCAEMKANPSEAQRQYEASSRLFDS